MSSSLEVISEYINAIMYSNEPIEIISIAIAAG